MKRRKRLKPFKHFLEYLGIRFLIFWICVAPRKLMIPVAGAAGRIAFRLMGKGRRKTINHLTLAYGPEKSPKEIERMALRCWVNIGKNAVDIIRYRKIRNVEDYHKILKVDGLEHIDAAYRKGRGVIGLTAHLGAFEMVATYLKELGYPVTVVGARLKNPRLNRVMVENRTLRGMNYVERGDNNIAMIRALKRGDIMGMLIDQDVDKIQNVFVDYFGRKTSTPIGATVLAMRLGVPVIPGAIKRLEDDTHLITFKPALELVETGDRDKDIVTNTQILSDSLEAFVKDAPEQWTWMHNRWKTKPREVVT